MDKSTGQVGLTYVLEPQTASVHVCDHSHEPLLSMPMGVDYVVNGFDMEVQY